ncbi:hypothetical protein FHG66_05165 [Rubellimicrobium rubrum]|uniref:Flagellar protein FlgJ N-terminal domain-containing protein n=2 Tax=Rubellimicrobium rubrum TaxID=2585369 RepID=A0A5C4N1M1_9RHOB|nr:rod-binding protein [Rubellimicrobium rubrum]TNC51681.1 hypothetical protein FHG66_05165 [Rubellimicrobium rubrum]
MITALPSAGPTAPDATRDREARLREAAIQLEAGFLKQMLSEAGLGRAPAGLDGGAGEDQFSSFLLDAQARRMAEAGGIGLAESLFEALKARDHG